MQPMPRNISDFFKYNHVVSIATTDTDGLWCASCFYVFDEAAARLIVLTSRQTRHGANMAASAHIAGTIAGQPDDISRIRGIQFQATAQCLKDGDDRKAALSLYYQAHPIARAMKSEVWALLLDTVKLTDNQSLFAQKTHWSRQNAV